MISVITVTLNSEASLKRTLDSLEVQNEGFEYIVVDGGSSDGTLDIISASNFVSKWTSEPDSGIYNAMNKGISIASGELIGILNSDDEYMPNTLSDVAKTFLSSDRRSVIYGNMIVSYSDSAVTGIGDLTSESIENGTYQITHPTMFVPRTIYEEFGGFDESFNIGADREFVLRLAAAGIKFIKLEQPLARFFLGGASSQKSLRFALEQSLDEFKIARRYYPLIKAIKITWAMFFRLFRNAALSWFLSDHEFLLRKVERVKGRDL